MNLEVGMRIAERGSGLRNGEGLRVTGYGLRGKKGIGQRGLKAEVGVRNAEGESGIKNSASGLSEL